MTSMYKRRRGKGGGLAAVPSRLGVAVAVCLAALAPPAAGQMLSPLRGQGSPDLATTDVYVR